MSETAWEETQQPSKQGLRISPSQQMIASSTGALLTSLMMTPLDVVKIRLQSQAKPAAFTKGHCFVYCNGLMDHLCPCVNGLTPSSQWYKRPGHFNGTLDALLKIARYEGVTSLWSGLPPTLVMAIPATVVYFTCYEQLRTLMGYREDVLSDQWKPPAAGAVARVWAATLISPIEMLRTKVQSEHLTYSKVFDAVRDMVKSRGVLSLWRGLGPTLLRDVPFSALYWGGYEAIKASVLISTGRDKLKFSESFLAGASSGSVAAVITLPFDVIKTRRQIELGQTEILGQQKEVSSTWRIIHKIYAEEGFRALYAGLLPRLAKVAPSCAIMVSTYEFFKYFFMNQNLNKGSTNGSYPDTADDSSLTTKDNASPDAAQNSSLSTKDKFSQG
ncbi:solute carrier family 25 member 40 [Aplysia californica]|uniref:Solute carrier family 25 member 40 n=1 Tax=Aplysia californica TaxID=6500 RepID=A0ABM0K883_APLCA|nr:solute carrier family 25 member 40 [Aplysia californica]